MCSRLTCAAVGLAGLALCACDRDEVLSAPEPIRAEETEQSSADAVVRGRVQTSLTSEGIAPPLHHVTVSAESGVVTLKGKVGSHDARVLAGTIAERTLGVSGVNNQLIYDR